MIVERIKSESQLPIFHNNIDLAGNSFGFYRALKFAQRRYTPSLQIKYSILISKTQTTELKKRMSGFLGFEKGFI